MSARSRALPWWGERNECGLFCCMSPVDPEAAQEWSNYRAAEADPLRDMRWFNEVAVQRLEAQYASAMGRRAGAETGGEGVE